MEAAPTQNLRAMMMIMKLVLVRSVILGDVLKRNFKGKLIRLRL